MAHPPPSLEKCWAVHPGIVPGIVPGIGPEIDPEIGPEIVLEIFLEIFLGIVPRAEEIRGETFRHSEKAGHPQISPETFECLWNWHHSCWKPEKPHAEDQGCGATEVNRR